MKKVKNFSLFYLVFFITIVVIARTFSLEIPKIGEKIELKKCELSEEYINWEKLSDEEKQNTVMPIMCKQNEIKSIKKYSLKNGSNELPSYYDPRDTYANRVKNQLHTNGCWSFSSTTMLEYYVNKNLNLDYEFSTRHMVYSTTEAFLNGELNIYGFNKIPQDGGNFFMSTNYYINSQGPVLESDMPFEDNEDVLDINSIYDKDVKLDVNDIIFEFDSYYNTACTTTEITQIKEYIYDYGSVAISTHMTEYLPYYNSLTSAFYYNGAEGSNHAVTIVGWDDSYSRDNFYSYNKPNRDGAWIVQNSYGTSFGDNGYYYISYEDVHVCDVYIVIKNVEEEVEDNAYVLDTLGFNTFYGFSYGNNSYKTAYAMNVFTKELDKKEELSEITFASAGPGRYELYYTAGNGKDKSVSDMTFIGSGNLEHAGYVTHKLDEPILLDEEVSDFSIVVYYSMDFYTTPLAVSEKDDYFYKNLKVHVDKSFASMTGSNWQDFTNTGDIVASIKAYTKDVEEKVKITSDVYNIDDINLLIYVQPNTTFDEFKLNTRGIDDIYYTGNLYTGLNIDDYIVIVLGDVTGDGSAKMNDVMMISNYIVDGTGLDDISKKAADVNNDSSIKMNDVMKISNYIVEGGSI